MNKDMKVLIVDDFATMRRIVRNLLLELGFSDIEEADDGKTALPILKRGRVDFLVTDWNMPGMDGLDLVRHVRSSPDLKGIPILMVTAEAKKSQIIEAAQAGINGYIVKPFTASTLNEKIERIFARISQG